MLALLAALCLASCDDYDDTSLWQKVNDHEERLAALEQWQEETNHNISAIQQLLNTTDCITAVTPLMEGGQEVGYTIQFLHSDPITIYHGTKGDTGHTPQIGLTQGDDGNWYWTLDGQLMQDADGNPIRANGEDGADGADGEDGSDGRPGSTGRPGTSAPTPQIKQGSTITSGTIRTDGGTAQADAWYLSVDDGRTWYRVSGKDGNDGDAFFAAAPTLSADGTHYIFKLSDNTEIKVPAYRSLQIGDDAGTGPLYIESTGTTVRLTYPAGTTADDYTALMAQIVPDGSDGTYTDISTRADNAGGWSVTADLAAMTVTVTPGTGTALLRVTLVGNDGSEVTRTRVVKPPFEVQDNTYIVYTAQGLLAWAQNAASYNCTLAADIDMSGQTWPQITNFGHTFDGAGHIISNLSISASAGSIGFIGKLKTGGTVKNLLLKDATVNSSYANTGGIIGAVESGMVTACAVSGCTVSGLVNVGGIAGGLVPLPGNSASVTACYAASCTVTGNNSGDIAGNVGVGGSVTACYYDGTGNGIGVDPGSATQVTDGNWQSAAEEMNKQLSGN